MAAGSGGGRHAGRRPSLGSTPGNTIDLTGNSDDEEVVMTGGDLRFAMEGFVPVAHSFALPGVSTAQRLWESLYPRAPAGRAGSTAASKEAAVPVGSPPVEKPCAVCMEELSEPACGPCGCDTSSCRIGCFCCAHFIAGHWPLAQDHCIPFSVGSLSWCST